MQENNKIIRIAVDAMGGDFAPEYPVLGALRLRAKTTVLRSY